MSVQPPRRLLGLLLLLCLLLSPAAFSQDHIVERAWFDDPTGQMTLEDVRQRTGKQFSGALTRGFGSSAVWLRLRIDPGIRPPARQQPDQLVLRIRPVYLDDIQVFDPLAPGGRAGIIGDRHHPRLDLMQDSDFMLPLARGDAPRDLWLRLTSTSSRQIHVAVLNMDDLAPTTLRQDIVFSLHVGLVLTLVVWGLVNWAVHREALMGAFAFKQFAALLFALSSLGFLRTFWPSAWSAASLDIAGSVFSVTTVSAAVLFHALFLAEFRPARWALNLVWGMLALFPVNLALLALGHIMPALQINMNVMLLGPIISMACALTGQAWSDPDPLQRPALPRRIVLAFYLMILVLMVLAAMTGLGLAPALEWTIYISQAHGLVTGVLVLMMLQYRAYLRNRLRQDALLTLERTRQQAQHERLAREDQEKLLAMLAHEIKTPLATMHMRLDAQAAGNREIRQAMRDMNGVIERCLQAAQLGDGRLSAQMHTHDLISIVQDAVSACSQPQRISTDLPGQLPIVTDHQLLFIVLGNLLENACKYSAEETPIELRVSTQADPELGDSLQLELRNQPGVAGWPDAASVFEKYYRSAHAQRQAGTGLGLYLVRNLATTLGGRIEYVPDATWVRFVLTLPLLDKP